MMDLYQDFTEWQEPDVPINKKETSKFQEEKPFLQEWPYQEDATPPSAQQGQNKPMRQQDQRAPIDQPWKQDQAQYDLNPLPLNPFEEEDIRTSPPMGEKTLAPTAPNLIPTELGQTAMTAAAAIAADMAITASNDPITTTGQLVGAATAIASEADQPKVDIGGGLPALPARPSKLERQQSAIPSKAPKTAVKPRLDIPSDSDLEIVGKLGAFQVANSKNPASFASRQINLVFWTYTLTLFITLFLTIKAKRC